MALKIFGATAFRAYIMVAAMTVAAVCVAGLDATDASAQQPKKQRDAQRDPQGRSLSYSYQAGPRTRVYVSRRSWLDAGTEVLPGERKFTDYAFPPGYHYGRSIDRLNAGRNPLSDNFDLGGGPTAFPLY